MAPDFGGDPAPRRLRGLPSATVAGCRYPIAATLRSRLLGLSRLDRERAGPGLLIERCRSVHTFGMRFALDVFFLDSNGRVLALRAAVPPRRIVTRRGARAVLEIPAMGSAPKLDFAGPAASFK